MRLLNSFANCNRTCLRFVSLIPPQFFFFRFLSQLLPAADLEARVLAPLVRARAEALDDLCSKVYVR